MHSLLYSSSFFSSLVSLHWPSILIKMIQTSIIYFSAHYLFIYLSSCILLQHIYGLQLCTYIFLSLPPLHFVHHLFILFHQLFKYAFKTIDVITNLHFLLHTLSSRCLTWLVIIIIIISYTMTLTTLATIQCAIITRIDLML